MQTDSRVKNFLPTFFVDRKGIFVLCSTARCAIVQLLYTWHMGNRSVGEYMANPRIVHAKLGSEVAQDNPRIVPIWTLRITDAQGERTKEENQNFHVCFSQLLNELAELLGHFWQLNGNGFWSVGILSDLSVVLTKLLPYLKYRQPFWTCPSLHKLYYSTYGYKFTNLYHHNSVIEHAE